MKNITQVHGITPEELKEIIVKEIKLNFNELSLNSKPNQECYLTRQEAATLLRISLPTLTDYYKRGIIPYKRIGNRILFKASEIEETIDAVSH